MTKITISLSLSEEVLNKIDLDRKLVSRSAYVGFILKEFFEKLSEDRLRCAETG